MRGAAGQMLLVIAALFLSAGHAACACLSAVQEAAPVVQTSMSGADHAHHHDHGGGDDGDEPDHSAPSPGDCGHCVSVALAGDGKLAAGSLPAPHKSFLIAASPVIVSTLTDHVGALARRLHWAAPPRRTPVSLKIRLRN